MPQQCLLCSLDEAEAWAKYDEVIRAEWDSMMDPDDDGPYPGDPDEAQDRIRQAHGAEWSRWELTRHEIEILGREIDTRSRANPRLPLRPAVTAVMAALSRFALAVSSLF